LINIYPKCVVIIPKLWIVYNSYIELTLIRVVEDIDRAGETFIRQPKGGKTC
jgi:hypothetical protein